MFVYSCSIKTHALGFDKPLESIFCLLLIVEAFSLQKVVELLEKVVVYFERSGEHSGYAELRSPVCSTFEVLVVQHVVGHCRGELGPFCRPVLVAGFAVFGANLQFAEHTSQM